MKDLKTLKTNLLADADTCAAYQAQAAEFEIARKLILARIPVEMMQAEQAKRIETTQSSVPHNLKITHQ